MRKWLVSSIANRALALVALAGFAAIGVAALGAHALGLGRSAALEIQRSGERAMLAEQLNGVIYRIVMESRGIYASKTTAEAKPFAKNLVEGLAELNTVMGRLEANAGHTAEIIELARQVQSFTQFRAELARVGVEVSPQEADKLGNNATNRANRAGLNKLVVALLDDARSEAAQSSQRLTERTQVLQAAFVAGAVLLALIITLGALAVLVRTVRRPLAEATAVLERVLRGEIVPITGTDRADELGTLARVMAKAQADALQVTADAERRNSDAVAARQRAERVAALQDRFSQVLGAAGRGDLDRRVEARFGDRDLDALGAQVDALLDTLQANLGATQTVLRSLGEGQLTARVEGRFEGAFAALQTDTNRLAGAFEDTLGRLATAVSAVRTATHEIHDGAADLANRTCEQAEVVAATTYKLGVFAGTFQDTARRAGEALGLARTAEDGTREGGSVLASASDAMERISSSSKKINDIIDLIDEIAFQTNLLALNAAVEAARAGDSGRGFAVVAAEVRSLAQRAAGASNDVKKLIVAAQADVDSGVGLVSQTAAVFERIFGSVNDVSRLMDAIAASSGTQARDIAGLTEDLGRIDDMAQQNAQLVEETNSALASTEQQAEDLESLVARFEYGGSGLRSRPRAA